MCRFTGVNRSEQAYHPTPDLYEADILPVGDSGLCDLGKIVLWEVRTLVQRAGSVFQCSCRQRSCEAPGRASFQLVKAPSTSPVSCSATVRAV